MIGDPTDPAALFTPLQIRGVAIPNRVVISPMSQSAAGADGTAGDWHLVHLGQFALGRPGLVLTEVTAVEPRGRVTHFDLGIWDERHIEPLARIVRFLEREGVVAGMQIGHAGRKGSSRRPWEGGMRALDGNDVERDQAPWETVAPSAYAFEDDRPLPRALSQAEIGNIVDAFGAAASRAARAGFQVLEIHGAHGYLIHQFLSATSNQRRDGYGGSRAGRTRLAAEIAETVRAAWPAERPLFFRVSVGDGSDPGWTMDDTVALVRTLSGIGVDVFDCSSGGIGLANYDIPGRRLPGFQIGLGSRIRAATGVTTMAVGLIRDPREAERIISSGQADLIAIGREALYDPRWPLRAAEVLKVDNDFGRWPARYGWWLAYRARTVDQARGGNGS